MNIMSKSVLYDKKKKEANKNKFIKGLPDEWQLSWAPKDEEEQEK